MLFVVTLAGLGGGVRTCLWFRGPCWVQGMVQQGGGPGRWGRTRRVLCLFPEGLPGAWAHGRVARIHSARRVSSRPFRPTTSYTSCASPGPRRHDTARNSSDFIPRPRQPSRTSIPATACPQWTLPEPASPPPSAVSPNPTCPLPALLPPAETAPFPFLSEQPFCILSQPWRASLVSAFWPLLWRSI